MTNGTDGKAARSSFLTITRQPAEAKAAAAGARSAPTAPAEPAALLAEFTAGGVLAAPAS